MEMKMTPRSACIMRVTSEYFDDSKGGLLKEGRGGIYTHSRR